MSIKIVVLDNGKIFSKVDSTDAKIYTITDEAYNGLISSTSVVQYPRELPEEHILYIQDVVDVLIEDDSNGVLDEFLLWRYSFTSWLSAFNKQEINKTEEQKQVLFITNRVLYDSRIKKWNIK